MDRTKLDKIAKDTHSWSKEEKNELVRKVENSISENKEEIIRKIEEFELFMFNTGIVCITSIYSDLGSVYLRLKGIQ